MGMYDTFGSSGDQLKIFDVPCYYFNHNQYDKYKETGEEYSFLGFMGGYLSNYPIDADVPWRALCYNYTPNFTVVDVGCDDDNYPYPTMIFGFSDGKLISVNEYDEEKLNDYSNLFGDNITVIDGYGALLTIEDIYMLRDFVDASLEEKRNRFRLLRQTKKITKVLLDYSRIITEDPNYKDKHDDCEYASQVLYEIEDKMLKANAQYVDAFYKENANNSFAMYGGYLDAVKYYGERNDFDKDLLPALLHEAQKYIEDKMLNLEDFFKWNQTPEEDKEWIREIDKKIREG